MKRLFGTGVSALALAALLPNAALANDTCNGFINFDYVGAPPVTPIGDVTRVRATLGTGSIQGGTKLTINSMQFNLDCNANSPLTPPCTDEGAIVQYEGDTTITTTCPTVWSTTHGVGPNANEVILQANPAVDIPAGSGTVPGTWEHEFAV